MRMPYLLGLTFALAACASTDGGAGGDVPLELTPEEAQELVTPGPMHTELAPLIGRWKLAGEWRVAPGTPWQEFDALAEREWVMDGRFVEERVQSEFLGQAFEGLAMIGYDNVRTEFTMAWFSSGSTGTWMATGQLDEDGAIVFEGENSDPMTGTPHRWERTVFKLDGAEQVYESWVRDADGNEFVTMRMRGTRD